MNYDRFEDLPVWQEAARLYETAEDLLENTSFLASRGFRDQLDRATLSVSNNIAEGFERGTTNELLSFLYIARGSAGEVRSMLTVKLRRADDPAMRKKTNNLITLAESCSRQLYAWAQSLQNSKDSVGQRRMTDQVRQQRQQEKSAKEFQEKLLTMLPASHPLRKAREERAREG